MELKKIINTIGKGMSSTIYCINKKEIYKQKYNFVYGIQEYTTTWTKIKTQLKRLWKNRR